MEYFRACREGSVYLWAIEFNSNGRHVGNLSATIDVPNRVAELALLVGERKLWGQGIGADAWNTAVEFLLGPAGLRKVVAGTMEANTGMLRVMERSRMVVEGRISGYFELDGRPVDLIMMGRPGVAFQK